MATDEELNGPELYDSAGERIVVFRNGATGQFFSNHPEFDIRRQLKEQADAEKAQAAEAQSGVEELVEDEPVVADNGDGVTTYEEMTTSDLGAEARRRFGPDDVPKPAKRSVLIKMLQDDDAAKAAAAQ